MSLENRRRPALANLEETLGSEHPDVATSLNNLATLYKSQGRYTEAEAHYREALVIQEAAGLRQESAATLDSLATMYQARPR
jgi:Tfp pilus assembly protein PilF